jgi:hypothetical protein
VCVCVCERQRERKRERENTRLEQMKLLKIQKTACTRIDISNFVSKLSFTTLECQPVLVMLQQMLLKYYAYFNYTYFILLAS